MAKSPIFSNSKLDRRKLALGISLAIIVGLAVFFAYSHDYSKLKVPIGLKDNKDAGLFVGEVPPGFDTDKDGFPDKAEQEAGSDPRDENSLPTDNGDYEPLSQVDVNSDGDFDITVTKAVDNIASVIVEHYKDFESIGASEGNINIANYGSSEAEELPEEPLADDSFDIQILKESNNDKVVKYIKASSLDIIVVSTSI